jgi:hypothetical protein
MRYVIESYKKEVSSLAYRIYISDCLKCIGRLDGKRYYDIYNEILRSEKISNINPEEESENIINNIKNRLRKMG